MAAMATAMCTYDHAGAPVPPRVPACVYRRPAAAGVPAMPQRLRMPSGPLMLRRAADPPWAASAQLLPSFAVRTC